MPLALLVGILGSLERIEQHLIHEHAVTANSFEDDSVYVSALQNIACARIHVKRNGGL